MSLFYQAARLNNEGIQSLALGNYPKSIEAFSRAVKALKEDLALRSIKEAGIVQKTKFNCTSSSQDAVSTVEIPSRQKRCDSFLFTQVLPMPEDKEETLTSVDIQMYSAVVVFNLAITYHHRCISTTCTSGCTNCHQQKSYVRMAEKLYVMAQTILRNDTGRRHQSCIGCIIQLASIANLSHLVHATECMSHTRITNSCNYHNYGMACEALRHLSTNHDGIFEDPKFQSLLFHTLLLTCPGLLVFLP